MWLRSTVTAQQCRPVVADVTLSKLAMWEWNEGGKHGHSSHWRKQIGVFFKGSGVSRFVFLPARNRIVFYLLKQTSISRREQREG